MSAAGLGRPPVVVAVVPVGVDLQGVAHEDNGAGVVLVVGGRETRGGIGAQS
jgi:hypothetical protein